MTTMRDLLRKATVRREVIDYYLDPDAPNRAVFDPELGYGLRSCIVRDGVDGSLTVYRYDASGAPPPRPLRPVPLPDQHLRRQPHPVPVGGRKFVRQHRQVQVRHAPAVLEWLWLLLGTLRVLLRSCHALLVEHLLLRQQLAVALRARPRPRLPQGPWFLRYPTPAAAGPDGPDTRLRLLRAVRHLRPVGPRVGPRTAAPPSRGGRRTASPIW